jgi:hypothetical protein
MKKLISILITLCFVSVIFGVAVAPQPAAAFSPVVAGLNAAKFVYEKIMWALEKTVGYAVTNIVNQSVDMFAQKMAYEVATSIATGGAGQKSLLQGKVFQNIVKDSAGAAAGDFIGGLSEEWEDYGIDLCDPSLDIKATITMSLLKFTTPNIRPRCDLSDIVKNWQSFVGEKRCAFGGDGCSQGDIAAAQEDLLKGLQVQFRPGKSDFAAQIALNDKILAKVDTSKIMAKLQNLGIGGYLPKLNPLKTQVETPASAVEEISEGPLETAQSVEDSKRNAALLAEHPILARAVSTFTNTLTSKLLQKWITEGMYKLADIQNYNPSTYTAPGGNDGGGDGGGGNDIGGDPITRDAIERFYSDFITTSFGNIEQYDPADEFIICPGQEDSRTLNNCVMSPKLYSAFSRVEPITVGRAIELQLLDVNMPLIPQESYLHSDLQYCHKDALCYSNLQKMRLARLIPLGWEIAANKSDPENPTTLGEAIAEFNTLNSEYKHLIDPDWILIAPGAQCRASGYGPILEAATSMNRSETCVDVQTCLRTKGNGECVAGAYGYCTREKNVWKFGGDQCSSAFASCRAYSADRQIDYYIKDTLDFCTADEVGCKWYSTAKNSDGGWLENNNIYLNAQAGTCEGQNAGCSELVKVEPGVNMIYNGDFDISNDDQPDHWSGADIYEDGKIQTGYDPYVTQQWIGLAPNTIYTISASAAQLTANDNADARIIVQTCNSDGNCNDSSPSGGVADIGTCLLGGGGHPQNIDLRFRPVSRNMERASCWFQTNNNTKNAHIIIRSATSSDESLWFDNIQLEIGNQSSAYVDYNSRNISYIKKAPDYLDCANNWTSECENYASYCTAEEIGCELYVPIDGDPAVPGIIAVGDYCSAECSGYEQYLLENTSIDNLFSNEDPRIYDQFIADTAQSCTLADVGCEAFTNTTIGETVEYYKQLRMCVDDNNPDATTYYTWEGSETAGFELRVWDLLQSDVDDGPCTSILYNGTANVCDDNASGIDICEDENDPACRYYIDEDNNEYLRRETKVVKVSDQCVNLRRGIDSTDMAIVLPSESVSCSEVAVGCKKYRGNNGSNTRRVFVDDFETSSHGWSGGVLSSTAVVSGGHSYKVSHDSIIRKQVSLSPDKSYIISFWVKANANYPTVPSVKLDGEFEFNNIENATHFTNEWQQFEFGPIYYHYDSAPTNYIEELTIDLNIDQYYIDNIIFKETNADLYLIRNSWPRSQCGDIDLGCQEYKDLDNNTHYLRSFDSLCSENAVGCSMFIDTKNSKSPQEQSWSMGDGETITTPADELVYLVDDGQYYCGGSNKGCSILGLPQISPNANGDDQIDSWHEVYFMNDPDKYELTLCTEEALWCKEYESDGQTVYMRDPGEHICSYLDNFDFNGELLTGWYLTSSVNDINVAEKIPCNDNNELLKRRDSDWDGMVGSCSAESAGCTEFVDPQGTQGDNLLYNGNFELDTTLAIHAPDFWCEDKKECESFVNISPDQGRDHTSAVHVNYENPDDDDAFSQKISVEPNKLYSVSFDLLFESYNAPGDNPIGRNWFVNKAYAADPIVGNSQFHVGIECDGETLESYDNSFVDIGDDVYMMTIDGSQTSASQYYTFNGKFVVDSSNNSIECMISFGDNAGSVYYLDNASVKEMQSYYYINDKNINGADCSGQVSWDEGCVLMYDTSNIDSEGEVISQYDSSNSYNRSVANNGNMTVVSGCSPDDVNCISDSNRIVKVVKNRECSEWLACRSASYATQIDGTTKEYCYDLGRCTELSEDGKGCNVWRIKDNEVLSEDIYADREIGWSGNEYSGYSLLNKYNLEALLAKTRIISGDSKLELSSVVGDGVDGSNTELDPACRLFPDAGAPFSPIGLDMSWGGGGNILQKPANMTQANFCNQGSGCECDYQKVAYSGGETRYYRADNSNFSPIIVDEVGAGPEDDIVSNVTSVNKYQGFWGFCLERDYSRKITGYVGDEYPCLTWMPLDILSGEYDPAGVDIEADLGLDFNNMYYCVQSEGNWPYSDEIIVQTSLDLGENAPENENFLWENANCGQRAEYYYPRQAVSYIEGFPDDSTIAVCMNVGSNQQIVSVDVDSTINMSYDNVVDGSIEFKNIVAGRYRGNPSPAWFVNGYAGDELLCGAANGSTECKLLELGGDVSVELNIADEIDCTDVHDDFCKNGEVMIWVKAFKASSFNGGTYQAAYNEVEWDGYTEIDLSQSLNDIASLANDNDEMFVILTTSFNSSGEISRHEVMHIIPSNYSMIQGFIYNVTINHTVASLISSEICTEFNQVSAPKFNDFINGPSIPFLPKNQYYNYYGMSNINFDLDANTYTEPIHVETIATSNDGYVAGTPYSISVGGNIDTINLNDCASGEDHCFGVYPTDDDNFDDAAVISFIDENTVADADISIDNAREYLKKLFTKIVKKFTWHDGVGYSGSNIYPNIDTRDTGSAVKIRQVEVDEDTGEVSEGDYGITINNKNGSSNIGYDGSIYNATMKFYAYNEDGNQLPLSKLIVDWGDGDNNRFIAEEVSLKNHKNICVNNCTDSIISDNWWEVFTTKGWEDSVSEDNAPSWAAITQGKADAEGHNWVAYHMDSIKDINFSAGDIITLEYDFYIGSFLEADAPITNLWCYSNGWCSQGSSESGFNNEGQTERYPSLRFDDTSSLATSHLISTTSDCPEGTEDLSPNDNWCRYSSTRTIPVEMLTGCYNDDNPSGNCLRDLGVGILGHYDWGDNPASQTYRIRNLKLRFGCRNNGDCLGTRYGDEDGDIGTCEAENVGNDLNYCVDDVDNSIGYFSFNHTYICSNPGEMVYPDTDPDRCIYQPKVYVEDNWGWCGEEYDYGQCVDAYDEIIGWTEYGDLQSDDITIDNKQIRLRP